MYTFCHHSSSFVIPEKGLFLQAIFFFLYKNTILTVLVSVDNYRKPLMVQQRPQEAYI